MGVGAKADAAPGPLPTAASGSAPAPSQTAPTNGTGATNGTKPSDATTFVAGSLWAVVAGLVGIVLA